MPIRPIMRSARCLVAAVAMLPLALRAADDGPIITIFEGQGTIVAGTKAYVPAQGVALGPCDAVHTGPKGLMQVEYGDGAAVVLGPDSRLMFGVPRRGGTDAGANYLLSGWAKFTVPAQSKAGPHRIATPHFDLQLDAGIVAVRVTSTGGQAFVERGSALVRAGGGETNVAADRTYLRNAGQPRGTVSAKLDPEFVKAMPAPLRETLPSLRARVKTREVTARPAADPDASVIEPWRNGDLDLTPCLGDVTVRRVQEALQRRGVDVGPIDGLLGPRTRAAIAGFQQQNGLPPSGQPDDATLTALDLPGRR